MIRKTQNVVGKGIGSISDPGECGCSGGVDTPSARAATAAIMGKGMDISKIPPRSVLGRNATPYDIARAVYFLVSGLSDYMTGRLVLVDGGYLLL